MGAVNTDVVFVHADGGSRGNPGIAGSGTVVYDASHKTVLRELAFAFGTKVTNNVAEYRGLIVGLQAARELGARTVHVFMDSKLVVEQMSGRWKIKNPDMQRMALEAKKLVEGFDKVTFDWVPRAKNAAADALANQAMDAVAAGHPEGLLDIDQPDLGESGDTADEAPDALDSFMPTAAEQGAPTTVILVRHGQTESSAQHKYAGQHDTVLTARGHEQAEAAAQFVHKRYRVDAVVASPLRRAQQTAEHIVQAVGGRVVTEPLATELDFGSWDGLTFAAARARDPQLHAQWLDDPTVAPPGGQSIVDFDAATGPLLASVVERYPGQTVVVVTHVHPIKAALRRAVGADVGFYGRTFLDLGGVSVLEARGSKLVVRSMNVVP